MPGVHQTWSRPIRTEPTAKARAEASDAQGGSATRGFGADFGYNEARQQRTIARQLAGMPA